MSQVVKFNFTQEQIDKLCAMQDDLNTYIHPEWKTQRFDWNTAIIDECMEIKEHLGWKWWKGNYKVGLTESNIKQVQLEVIDILHFVLSSWIEDGTVQYLLENFNAVVDSRRLQIKASLESEVNNLIMAASNGHDDCFGECFTVLAHEVGLTEQQIMETYVQKFVLNKFRQDHGYKTGEYVKVWKIQTGVCDDQWEMVEDNGVLEYIAGGSTDETELYSRLKEIYNSRLN